MGKEVDRGVFGGPQINENKPTVLKHDSVITSVDVTRGGWVQFARYRPTITIPYGPDNSVDFEGATKTEIEGIIWITHVAKVG